MRPAESRLLCEAVRRYADPLVTPVYSPRATGLTRFSSPALEAPLSEGLLVSDDNGRERLPFKKVGCLIV